jgi:fucose permease
MIRKLFRTQGLQGILTLGYLYIVILGILGEALYYSQLYVNILNYSNLTDILISPIAKLTSNYVLILFFLAVLLLLFTLSRLPQERKNKIKLLVKWDGTDKTLDTWVHFFAFFLFSFYVGLDVGFGSSTSRKLEEGTLKHSDHITFSDGKKLEVSIVGVNSGYVFYVKPGEKRVEISPMGALQSFDRKPTKLNFPKSK